MDPLGGQKKHQRSRLQALKLKEKEKESCSFTTTDTRSRKASIGVTVAFSNRNHVRPPPNHLSPSSSSPSPLHDDSNPKVPRSSPQELTALNGGRKSGCGGMKTWTPLNPFRDKALPNAEDSSPSLSLRDGSEIGMEIAKNSGGRQEITCPKGAVQSTRIVEEQQFYANRKSVMRFDGNGCHVEEATRECGFVKYERRNNKRAHNSNINNNGNEVVGEFSFQRREQVKQTATQVRFDLDRDSEPPSPCEKRNEDKNSEVTLRMKLRNAFAFALSEKEEPEPKALLNSSEKEDPEPKSDTIETDSQERNQAAKPLERIPLRGRQRRKQNTNSKKPKPQPQRRASAAKRKISPSLPSTSPPPPAVSHIFSFNQDECLQDFADKFSSKFRRNSRISLPQSNGGNASLPTSPEKKRDESPANANAVVDEMHSDHHHQESPGPSDANAVVVEMHSDHHHPQDSPSLSDTNALVDEMHSDHLHQESPSLSDMDINGPAAARNASTTHIESLSASFSLSPNHEKLAAEEKATESTVKEQSLLFMGKDAIRRSSRRAPRKTVIDSESVPEVEPDPCRRRQVKRKARELTSSSHSKQSSLQKCVPHTEDGSEDSSDLMGVVKLFTGVLQKFKRKLKMEVDRKASQVLSGASHSIQKQLDSIQSQIQSDILKYASLCKSKNRKWEANLQDQNEKLTLIHEKFKKYLAQHSQSCQNTLSQIEREQIELKSIAERQRVSHKKIVYQIQELIESELADAERKITAVRKAAANNMHALKHAMGGSF